MLFMVWVGAFVPFTWVMVVGVGVSWWCCFQCRVAVVPASRRVPGVGVCVSWLVPGASVGVAWLVCVLWWFRMLTCSGLFLVFLVLSFVWLITGCIGFGVVACVFVVCVLVACFVWFCSCLWGVGVLSCCVRAPWWLVLFVGRGWWCALVGYWVVVLVCLACARILCVCGLVLFLFVGCGRVWHVW